MQQLTKKCLAKLRSEIVKAEASKIVSFPKFTAEFVVLTDALYEKKFLKASKYARERNCWTGPLNYTIPLTVAFDPKEARLGMEKLYIMSNSGPKTTVSYKSIDFAHIPLQYEIILVYTNSGVKSSEDCIKSNIGGRLVIIF